MPSAARLNSSSALYHGYYTEVHTKAADGNARESRETAGGTGILKHTSARMNYISA